MWVKRLSRLLLPLLMLVGCSGDPGSGPVEPKWDRDACERCRMVLSDRHFAAQVRYWPEGKERSKILWFDDIGCAVLWLQDKPWRDAPSTEIWVADHRNGKWIDARTATYLIQGITPMAYGLSAQTEPAEGGLNFAQAKEHVLTVEQKLNQHSAHLLEQLRKQEESRD